MNPSLRWSKGLKDLVNVSLFHVERRSRLAAKYEDKLSIVFVICVDIDFACSSRIAELKAAEPSKRERVQTC